MKDSEAESVKETERMPQKSRPSRVSSHAVILLDWSGVDLAPKSTPYTEKAVEL